MVLHREDPVGLTEHEHAIAAPLRIDMPEAQDGSCHLVQGLLQGTYRRPVGPGASDDTGSALIAFRHEPDTGNPMFHRGVEGTKPRPGEEFALAEEFARSACEVVERHLRQAELAIPGQEERVPLYQFGEPVHHRLLQRTADCTPVRDLVDEGRTCAGANTV